MVVGFQADQIKKRFADPRIAFALQEEQLGTGHAVLQALPLLKDFTGTVLILCGDVPLVKEETVRSFIEDFQRRNVRPLRHDRGCGKSFRIRTDCPKSEGWLERIVEEKDARDEEKAIREINTGIYCVNAPFLAEGLKEIGKAECAG